MTSLKRCMRSSTNPPRTLRLSSSNLQIHTRVAQFFEHCFRDFVSPGRHGLLWCRQTPYDFPLPLARNLAIACKSRQHFFMPEVLAP